MNYKPCVCVFVCVFGGFYIALQQNTAGPQHLERFSRFASHLLLVHNFEKSLACSKACGSTSGGFSQHQQMLDQAFKAEILIIASNSCVFGDCVKGTMEQPQAVLEVQTQDDSRIHPTVE